MSKKNLLLICIFLIAIFTISVVAAGTPQGKIKIHDSVSGEVKEVNYEASGKCYKVVDGDTIWVEGIGKIRFVQVNTPERGEDGYYPAKDFVKEHCLNKKVYLDIDDKHPKDKYNRTLAIVYTEDGLNLNIELLHNKLAKVMFIPPSEFQKGLGAA